MSNNQLVAIEQKPSLMDSIKSFFYKIGNGAKKMDGEFENLKDTTNSIKNSDIPALEKKYMDEGIKQAMFIEEKNSELVVGKKESRANTEMFKEVTKSRLEGVQKASDSDLTNILNYQKLQVVNQGQQSLQKASKVRQIEKQNTKTIEEEDREVI